MLFSTFSMPLLLNSSFGVDKQESITGKRVDPPNKTNSQGPLKLFSDNMVPNSCADNVAPCVAWMFSWRIKMPVKPLGLTT